MVMGEKSLLVVKMQRWLRRAVSPLILFKHSSGPTSCWCSWASAHILPGLPSICSAGCSPGPSSAAASAQSCPVARPARSHKWARWASHQVGKNIKTIWHPKIWTPLEAFLPFRQCRIEQRGVSSKKRNKEDDLVAQGISSKVSLVNAPSLKLSSLKTKLHQLDI